jgi:xylose dehydrogenase (NAD/NADP)
MGTGNIARQFAQGVSASERGTLAVVGSRQLASAESFAAANGVASAVGSYQELIQREDVDAIYVSLPNSMHKEWTVKSLTAGKHVLCEKPFALDAAEAEEMFAAAVKHDRVLVEAFMYRSHPLTHAVRKAIADGTIGSINLIRTSFCYRTTSFARMIAGAEPSSVYAAGQKHETGVDIRVAGTLVFPNGILSTFNCAMDTQADNIAMICGSEGWIEVPVPWKPSKSKAIYTIARGTPPRMDTVGKVSSPTAPPRQTFEVDAGGELYGLEADDFAATVLDGRPPVVSRHDTLGNMRVIDEMRRQIGIAF